MSVSLSRHASAASHPRALGERAPRWLAPLVLLVPFVVAIAALHGLTDALVTFHGDDEDNFHVPTILGFARDLPGVDLVHYRAAQTPLFHLAFAVVGKVLGFELWRLRLVNALVSYAAVLVLLRMLQVRVGLGRAAATALAGLFALSPYVFGPSFLLLTDNLAVLWVLLALDRLWTVSATGDRRALVLAAVLTGLALLTRQSTFWLVGVVLWVGVRAPLDLRGRLVGLSALALSLAPLGALVLAWGGLVPPTGDPRSCGLCSAGRPDADPGPFLDARALLFTLGVAGLYGLGIFGPGLLSRARRARVGRGAGVVALAAALAAAGLLAASRLVVREEDAGLLWRLAEHGPRLGATPAVLWVLVPLGAAVLAWRARVTGLRSPAVLALGAFLLSTLATRLVWQKYFDPWVLLGLVLTLRPGELGRGRAWAGVAALAAGSVAYALSFSA